MFDFPSSIESYKKFEVIIFPTSLFQYKIHVQISTCDRTLTLSQRIELWRWPSFIAAQESLSSCMVHFSVRVLDKGILYWALTGLSANYLCSPCVFNVSINFLQPFQACCWIGFCRLKITEGLNVLFPIADSPSFRTPVELNFSISLYSFSCQ